MADKIKEDVIKGNDSPEGLIIEINKRLMAVPDALAITLRKRDTESFDAEFPVSSVSYQWLNQSEEAKKTREEIRELLKKVWQGGTYNYSTLVNILRTSQEAIQGILDDDFRMRYNL